jgi:DNA-binding MarR family transcriptional regulator
MKAAPQDDVCDIEQAMSHLIRGAVSLRLHERISADTGVSLERAGYWVLGRLADRGPLRLSELAQMIALDPSTVSRQVRQLERQGLAERSPDPSDARAAMLAPTPAGREVLGRVRTARRELMERVLARWPAQDRRELARLLARLADDLAAAWREEAPEA